MRSLTFHFLTFLFLASFTSASYGVPMKEARGMYVCRWDLGTPQAIDLVVDQAAKHGYNILIVQMRGSGDTMYHSKIEPPSYYLKKSPPDFDALAYCLDKAHAEGIEVHAWLNTLYTWYTESLHEDPNHITNRHPDWLMMDYNGKIIRNSGLDTEGAYLCPSREEARAHVASVFLEVVRRYDVDGIHFDFVRYPNQRVCYCDVCLSRFRELMKLKAGPDVVDTLDQFKSRRTYPVTFPDDWNQFRRDQVTALVSTVYREAKKIKPHVAVSASVFADSVDAANYRFQDWKRWMKDGILDVLCPMAYGTSTAYVQSQIRDAVANSNGRQVWAGLGAWVNKPDQLAEKIIASRKEGAVGQIMFDSASMIGDGSKDYLSQLDVLCYQEPAEMPEIATARRKP